EQMLRGIDPHLAPDETGRVVGLAEVLQAGGQLGPSQIGPDEDSTRPGRSGQQADPAGTTRVQPDPLACGRSRQGSLEAHERTDRTTGDRFVPCSSILSPAGAIKFLV